MEWISVEHKLPEETVLVACWIDNLETPRWSNYSIGMNENNNWYLSGGRKIHEVVTHWMPLPEPPNKKA